MVLLFSERMMVEPQYMLKNMVLEPECKPFYSNNGENFYRYAAKEPKFNKLFQEFMTHSSKLFLDEVLKVYRGFEEIKELLDVGGGMGTSLGNIISMYPHIHGKNFDLPNVISVALKLSGLTFSSFLFLYFFGNVYLLHIPYITYMPLLHKICDKRHESC